MTKLYQFETSLTDKFYTSFICCGNIVEGDLRIDAITGDSYDEYPPLNELFPNQFTMEGAKYIEKEGKVYEWFNDFEDRIELIIDMSAHVGDTIYTSRPFDPYYPHSPRFKVIDEGSVETNGIKRKALKLEDPFSYVRSKPFLWIEGIGAKNMTFQHISVPRAPGKNKKVTIIPVNESGYVFVACYKDGECIFTAEDFDKYVSDYEINNPGVGITDAETDSEEESSTKWYTIQGIRVAPPLAPGLYIRRCDKRTEKLLIH